MYLNFGHEVRSLLESGVDTYLALQLLASEVGKTRLKQK